MLAILVAGAICAGQETAPQLAPTAPAVPAPTAAQARLNADLIQEFQTKAAAYVDIHREAEKELGAAKRRSTATQLAVHERKLAEKIRHLRGHSVQGEIFTPRIAAEIRRLTGAAVEGVRGVRVEKSLARAEPVRFKLVVNREYPQSVPLQSVPPTLLLYLPELQTELEYRIVGHTLILRDTGANLVVDFMPEAIPET
jgi:hypothetical protein